MSIAIEWLRCATFASALLITACSTTAEIVPYTPHLRAPDVEAIELGGLYNVTLVRGARAVLVDTGPPGARDDLFAGLERAGVRPSDLALVVLTHGHSDHAGNARALQELGVPVLAHEADRGMLTAGDHGSLYATNLEAVLAQPLVDPTFPALTPDVELHGEERMRLDAYGIPAEVVHAGGHTEGSIVVHVDNGAVIVGDLVRGGWFAQLVDRDAPATHLYHAYPVDEHMPQAEDFVRGLAACRGVRTVFVGHGGPISIDAVRAWAADDEPHPCPW